MYSGVTIVNASADSPLRQMTLPRTLTLTQPLTLTITINPNFLYFCTNNTPFAPGNMLMSNLKDVSNTDFLSLKR